jgi:uncharacterized SAM-binding protein YcdF (DUF218 family)
MSSQMKIPSSRFRKKRYGLFFFMIITFFLAWLFRIELLQAAGNYLIVPDSKTPCETLFVLGGNSFERGLAAKSFFENQMCSNIVCTGGNVPSVLMALDTSLEEAEITKHFLLKSGIDSLSVHALGKSTSTLEEANEIFEYAKSNQLASIGVLSSKHHLKRVKKVFEKRFTGSSIEIGYFGAPSQQYNEDSWWNSEAGMIMVNNEYMKHIYYFIKH